MKRILYITLLTVTVALGASAQSSTNKDGFIRTKDGWEFELKAGVNFLGGTAPMQMPVEIRAIEGYKPRFGSAVEGVATKWFGTKKGEPEWGISSGLVIENRSMQSRARVKNYRTTVPMDNNTEITGHWTGMVEMEYTSTLLSLPVLANYRFNKDWKARAGLYVGYQLDGKFGGSVYDGYLRNGTPIGPKMELGEGQQALYDFTPDMQRWQWGARVGGSWRAYRHFSVNLDLNWGFSNLFKKSFKAIPFNMYPIYLQGGFSYQF